MKWRINFGLFICIGLFLSCVMFGERVLGQNEIQIQDVFIAQTHVLRPTDKYFKLVAEKPALLKVNLTASKRGIAAPRVKALISSGNSTGTLLLSGPAKVPRRIKTQEHRFENSFTVLIPGRLVQPGMKINIRAGNTQKEIDSIKVGAPNKFKIRYFDFRVFGDTRSAERPSEEIFEEMRAKLPITGMDVVYEGPFDLPAMTINRTDNIPAQLVTSEPKYNAHSLALNGFLFGPLLRANGEFYTSFYVGAVSTAGGGWGGGCEGVNTPGGTTSGREAAMA